MKHNNDEVRRRDHLLDEERALELEYAVLSMIDEEGLPYGIPISHIWDGAITSTSIAPPRARYYVPCVPSV